MIADRGSLRRDRGLLPLTRFWLLVGLLASGLVVVTAAVLGGML